MVTTERFIKDKYSVSTMHMRKNLLRIISEKYEKLQDLRDRQHSVNVSLRMRNRKTTALIIEAERHSYNMEVNGEQKKSGRLQKQQVEQVSEAWKYLSISLRNGFSEKDIQKANLLIVPEQYPNTDTAYYRNVNVMNQTNDPVLPPRAEKVPDQMKELTSKLNGLRFRTDYHPIEIAGIAHIALAYIHPFLDGNGRTARTVQNAYLDLFKFPVPVIRQEEKPDYQAILKRAMKSWRGEDEFGVPNFLNYLATKVNESLDEVLRTYRRK